MLLNPIVNHFNVFHQIVFIRYHGNRLHVHSVPILPNKSAVLPSFYHFIKYLFCPQIFKPYTINYHNMRKPD